MWSPELLTLRSLLLAAQHPEAASSPHRGSSSLGKPSCVFSRIGMNREMGEVSSEGGTQESRHAKRLFGF